MTVNELWQSFGIGLTGGIACGKSTVANLIRSSGHPVIDADVISREVVAPGTPGLREIQVQFGSEYLTKDGSLDRKKMRDLVFHDPAKRLLLEQIIHPRLHDQTLMHLKKLGICDHRRYWFYEASLIFEKSLASNFNQVWVAYCTLETQIERLMSRDQITRDQALSLIQSQMPAIEKAQRASHVINTECTMEELRQRVSISLNQLKRI